MKIEMTPRQYIKWPVVLLFCLLLFPFTISAQRQQAVATNVRLEKIEGALITHRLYVTVNGRERKITDQALLAWIIDDGKSVAYSWTDGSGGFENEGQSLRIYDVRTGRIRKVLSEFMMIVALTPVRLTTGELALLVKMEDGGLGGSYFGVVDPKRGEVFYRRWAEVTQITGDRITLAFYEPEDWEKIHQERAGKDDDPNVVVSTTKVKPIKVERHDLKRVLTMRVLVKKRTSL
jgi:hypothetical protein